MRSSAFCVLTSCSRKRPTWQFQGLDERDRPIPPSQRPIPRGRISGGGGGGVSLSKDSTAVEVVAYFKHFLEGGTTESERKNQQLALTALEGVNGEILCSLWNVLIPYPLAYSWSGMFSSLMFAGRTLFSPLFDSIDTLRKELIKCGIERSPALLIAEEVFRLKGVYLSIYLSIYLSNP